MGYYIRTKHYWSKQQDDPLIVEEAIRYIREIISLHMDLIFPNDWKGLLQLTNANGQFFPYSFYAYACSSATLLEVLDDLSK